MNEIIKINQNEQGEARVSARELYKALGTKKRFSVWFETNKAMFDENVDYKGSTLSTPQNQYGGLVDLDDYSLTIDMAKELAMMSRSSNGKKVRQYFIQVEKAWNSPDQIMARALQISKLKLENKDKLIAELQPKALFADAVSASHTSILVGELAKILKQNGIQMGQNKLFSWLRDNSFLIKRKGTDYNMPTQRAMEQKLFEIKETSITHPDGHTSISKTSKVTGKGQQYFINKFLAEEVKKDTPVKMTLVME